MFQVVPLEVTCNASGEGSVISEEPINGLCHAIHVIFDDQPSTVDVTVRTENVAPRLILLSRNDSNANILSPLRHQVVGSNGAAISSQYGIVPLSDYVGLVVTGGTNGKKVTARIYYEE